MNPLPLRERAARPHLRLGKGVLARGVMGPFAVIATAVLYHLCRCS